MTTEPLAEGRWLEYARQRDAWADYLESRDECATPSRNQAKSGRRTAESIRLATATGIEHCVCCLRPMSEARR